jgi:SAM-dependent methyltransferase
VSTAFDAHRILHRALNEQVLGLVSTTAKRVLDLGCGTGALGGALKKRQSTEVVGVTISTAEAELAGAVLDRALVEDLNAFNPSELGTFDCIVCSHVLGYLYAPDQFLRSVRGMLEPEGAIIVALPNILYWPQRLKFLRGEFRYTDGGILDRTYCRFFDWESARLLVRDAGFEIDLAVADGGFPGSRFLPCRHALDRFALRCFPGMFGNQFVIRGRLRGGEK